MDETMMMFLWQNVGTLIQISAAFVVVVVVVIAICVALITVFS
jgi:hypothetical protein